MFKNQKFFIFLLINFLFIKIVAKSFEDIWFDMQHKYNLLNENLKNVETDKFYASYYENLKNHVGNFIKGNPDINFLRNYEIARTMLRQDFDKLSAYEECFLNYCLSPKTKNTINNFKDNDNNLLPKPTNYGSVSALGHLYYAARMIESLKKDPQVFVEFGGGYGDLSRIVKSLYPEATIIIFDMPEIIAIQYLFLSYVMPNEDIIMHDKPIDYNLIANKKSINLVPVFFLEESKIKTDIFASTFALSETPKHVQDLVMNKNFFDADLIYMTGQINGWREIGIFGFFGSSDK